MELYEVTIEGSQAAYQRMTVDGEVFYDANGIVVDTPVEPIAYVYRSWCANPPAWA